MSDIISKCIATGKTVVFKSINMVPGVSCVQQSLSWLSDIDYLELSWLCSAAS